MRVYMRKYGSWIGYHRIPKNGVPLESPKFTFRPAFWNCINKIKAPLLIC